MDQGIIQAMKLKYRKRQMSHVVSQMELFPSKEGTECFREVNILQAIFWVSAAWDEVQDSTIQKCFAHGGFVHKDISVDDESSAETVEDNVPLKVLQLSKDLFDCEFNELAEIDQNFQTCETAINWDKPATELLADIAAESAEVASSVDQIPNGVSMDDDCDDVDAALYASSVVSIGKVHDCISKLRDYASYHGHSDLLATIMNLSDQISDIRATTCTKQTKIANFFKRV